MKRIITLFFLIIICFLLQTTIFQFLELANVVPNIMLSLTMSFGLMRGRREGLLVGFFCGLLTDIFFGFALGPYALIYMCLGYANGFFHRFYYVEDVLLPMCLIAVNDLLYNFMNYCIFFLMRNRLDFISYLKDLMIPELLYTILVTLILYKIFMKINKLLKHFEEGSETA